MECVYVLQFDWKTIRTTLILDGNGWLGYLFVKTPSKHNYPINFQILVWKLIVVNIRLIKQISESQMTMIYSKNTFNPLIRCTHSGLKSSFSFGENNSRKKFKNIEWQRENMATFTILKSLDLNNYYMVA